MRALGEVGAALDVMLLPLLRGIVGVAVVSVAFIALTPRPGCACKPKSAAYRTAMKSDLRNLVKAQEQHYTDHGHYARILAPDKFRRSTGVGLASMDVTKHGFIAVMDYPSRTAMRCFVIHARGGVSAPTCDQ